MDVGRGWKFLIALILLTGCGDDRVNQTEVVLSKSTLCDANKVQGEYLIRWSSGHVSKVTADSDEELIENEIEPNQGLIELVEPNYKLYPQPISENGVSAQSFSENFLAADNWGAGNIGAASAWTQNYKGQNVIVAVLDSGVDVSHPQLTNRIEYNALEVPNDGIDNDNNGLIDDYAGYNFFSDTANVSMTSRHGTHVAGIISAEHNDTQAMASNEVQGVAPEAKILPIKFMSASTGTTEGALKGIDYAVERNAKIINASWGGPDCSSNLKNRIAQLENEGVLFVAASGNNGLNIEVIPQFPASLILPNIITVGSIDKFSRTSWFSNFGEASVDLYAPGTAVYSTVPGGGIERESGTSMAAPFVSGAAAVLWSKKPSASVAEIKQVLLGTVSPAPNNVSSYLNATQGRLNLSLALQAL